MLACRRRLLVLLVIMVVAPVIAADLKLTQQAQTAYKAAIDRAKQLKHHGVGAEHFAWAIFRWVAALHVCYVRAWRGWQLKSTRS